MRVVLLLMLCAGLSGCRVRTGPDRPAAPEGDGQRTEETGAAFSESGPEDADPTAEETEGDSGNRTRENPEASRKEYDENRPAEIVPGAEQAVHENGEGSGLSGSGEEAEQQASKTSDEAEKTATRVMAAEEAEQKGTSEDAEQADSAATYFSVLLRERTGALFECQRQNVYWETAEDHRTVFKTSPEHSLILEAGAYDVSARLLEENLRVDDGWIGRKNPGVIVKVVKRSVLGTGVLSPDAARSVLAGLQGRDGWSGIDAVRNGRVLLLSEELLEAPAFRLAAALLIARTANPDRYEDVNPEEMLAMLGEEAAGKTPEGIFYYNPASSQ